jgi:uncharacterized membrane protein YfcA
VFLSQGIARAALFQAHGQYTDTLLVTAGWLLIPALLGQQAGLRLRGRLDAAMFQKILLAVLLVSSINLVWRGVVGAVEAARGAGLIG